MKLTIPIKTRYGTENLYDPDDWSKDGELEVEMDSHNIPKDWIVFTFNGERFRIHKENLNKVARFVNA